MFSFGNVTGQSCNLSKKVVRSGRLDPRNILCFKTIEIYCSANRQGKKNSYFFKKKTITSSSSSLSSVRSSSSADKEYEIEEELLESEKVTSKLITKVVMWMTIPTLRLTLMSQLPTKFGSQNTIEGGRKTMKE